METGSAQAFEEAGEDARAPSTLHRQHFSGSPAEKEGTMASNARPNIVLFGIDSLRADHMSCYGYDRLTSPYLDRFAQQGVLFENTISAHIPTTSAYASMLTGMDVFSTQVVALRHQGPLRSEVKTLAEILRDEGYHTVCVGFDGNPSSRGFDEYLSYKAWGAWEEGRLPKAQSLNETGDTGAGPSAGR